MEEWRNLLYYGDNLNILRDNVGDETVDFIYLDPPFNSNATYNVLFREKSGEESVSQITAFEDTWQWGVEAERAYNEIVTEGDKRLADLVQSLRSFLGQNDMMAYLTMMAIRLAELHRVLKPTGSIYMHCDPTASHYLKLLMDAVFSPKFFRNEIIWRRTGAHGKSKRYAPIHDVILFYTKSDDYTWNYPKRPFMKGHVEEYFVKEGTRWRTNYYGNVLTGSGVRGGESGKEWRGFNPTDKGRHWAIPGAIFDDIDEDIDELSQHEKMDLLYEKGYIKIVEGQAWPIYERYITPKDGTAVSDLWAFQPYTNGTVFGIDDGVDEDVRWLSPRDQERLSYPTQKPEGILARMIESSSNKGDVVLDPFCGCGTTVVVAEMLNRKWIGIDITHLAISLMRHRLSHSFGHGLSEYDVFGDPKDLAGAQALAEADKHQFELWALGMVGAFPAKGKKGADAGVDGYINIIDDNSGKAKKIIVQVKGGHVGVAQVRDLIGTVKREKAIIGVFITLHEPTKPMVTEALTEGFYSPLAAQSRKIPKIQILTVDDILNGKQIEYFAPENKTFIRAKLKVKGLKKAVQQKLI